MTLCHIHAEKRGNKMCIVTVLIEFFLERREQNRVEARGGTGKGGVDGRVCSHIKYRDTKQLMNYSFGNRYENKL